MTESQPSAELAGPSGQQVRTERWRVFVAVVLPDALRQRIEAALLPLRESTSGVRWTRSDGLHLTARFIGSVELGRVPEIVVAVREVAATQQPFRVALQDVGTFGGRRRPRVCWIGVSDGWRELASLEAGLSERLGHLEHRPRYGGTANRPSPPHITIARAVPDGLDLEIRRRLLELRGATWTAGSLTLFRSHLGPGGSRYEELADASFGG